MSAPVSDTHEKGLPLFALAGMLMAASLAPLGSTMIAVALPDIGSDIGAEPAVLTQWLVSSYLITSIALQSPGGKLGDLIGHDRALMGGLSLVAAGSLLGSVVDHVYGLGAARILMASGGAAIVPATLAIFRNQTAPHRRARMFGLFGACMGLAAAVGPLAGGDLTERFGSRAVFAANLPVVALSLLLVLSSRGRYRSVAARRGSFDLVGSAFLACGLTLAVVSVGLSGSAAWWTGGIGLSLLVLFPFWERRVPSPVVDVSVLTRRAFFAGGSIIALQNMAMYPLLFQLPVFFDRVRHLGARPMGQALFVLTVAMILGSMAGGRLAERLGARVQTLLGSLVALTGLWWFTDFESISAPVDVMPGMLLMGAGIGLTSPPAQAASMSAVAPEQAGMAGGMVSTMRYLGGVAGIAALGALLSESADPASHQRPVWIYAGALIAAAALTPLLPNRNEQNLR